jgi:hypothetical protein
VPAHVVYVAINPRHPAIQRHHLTRLHPSEPAWGFCLRMRLLRYRVDTISSATLPAEPIPAPNCVPFCALLSAQAAT